MNYVRRLTDIRAADVALVGGKAASLGELIHAGFDVPPGFCVTVDAYQAGAGRVLTDEVREEVLTGFRQLRELAMDIAPNLTEPLRFAVRSSAVAEDTPNASFAGIYRTFLGLKDEDEILKGVAGCWESGRSAEAGQYARERLAAAASEMAVVVQALVPSEVSGVMFTAHPVSAALDTVVISSSWGLGESVVAARVEADTFVARKRPYQLIESRIGSKKTAIGYAGTEIPVSSEMRSASSLNEQEVSELVRAAVRLETYYGFPQDVEWAFVGGRLYLLQARRVTTLQEAYYTEQLHTWADDLGLVRSDATTWVRGTSLSSLPLSPLYFSEMSRFFTDMFASLARLERRSIPATQNFRYFRGWSYGNADFGGGRTPPPTRLLDRAWLPRLRRYLRYPRSLAVWSTAGHYYRLRDTVWLPEIARRRPDYTKASPEEVIEFIEFIEVQRRERSIVAATGVDHAGLMLGLLEHYLGAWTNGPEGELLAELTMGLPELETYAENLEVWNLSRLARRSPAVLRSLEARSFEDLDRDPEALDFLRAVDAFRAQRPQRGASDRDLRQPRWGDSRELLLEQLCAFARMADSEDPASAHARAVEKRRRTTHRVEREVQAQRLGRLKLWFFRRILGLTQQYWTFRDNQRHSFDHYFFNLRCAYRALGARLVERDVLAEADDVFFLSKNEIYDLIGGKLPGSEGAYRAIWRRGWWQECSQQEPPEFLRGDEAWEPDRPITDDASGLKGTAGSSGTASGRARVVSDLRSLSTLQSGEILVTHAIDPAWTPVFGMLKGVITEEGGILSHVTVLAREYGIPAVIGLARATSAIRTGDLVTMDGSRGTVKVEPTPEKEGAA